jgi:hypothetical protein
MPKDFSFYPTQTALWTLLTRSFAEEVVTAALGS